MGGGGGHTGLREGVVHDADCGDLFDGEAEGDGDVGVAVDEVRCAVYGVEDDCRECQSSSLQGWDETYM